MTITERRRALMGAKKPRLPAEYQEVAWIGSSGTQYINTGIVPRNYPKMTIVFESAKSASETFQSLFGSQGDSYSGQGIQNRFSAFISGSNLAATANLADNLSSGTVHAPATAVVNFSTDTYVNARRTYIVDALSRTFSIDDVTENFNNGTKSYCNYPMYVFASNNCNALSSPSSGKLYSATYEDQNGNAFIYVPCYRKSDGVIGVYDLVSNAFLTNAGTGTFTKGADV